MPDERQKIQPDSSRRYELLVEIGTGGMGKVFLGRALGVGGFERIVAVKQCHPHLRNDEEFVAMFLDEARIAARIHHPNVVPTLDVGVSDVPFLVMEYVEGETLSRLRRAATHAGAPIPVGVALRIAADALAGLHAAHELRDAGGGPLGVVHRDVTPQNIIVGADGVSRILDFGIATAASRSTTTKEGHVKGKIGYMPPEQLGGEEATRQTDVYGLGVVLWEALSGERLFHGKTERDTMAMVLRGDIPSLHERRPDVDARLEAVILRALAREPDERFQTAAEFAEAIEDLPGKLGTARAVAGFVAEHAGAMLAERRAHLALAEGGHGAVIGDRESEADSALQSISVHLPEHRWPPAARWIALAALIAASAAGAFVWMWRNGAAAPADHPTGASPGSSHEDSRRAEQPEASPLTQPAPSNPVPGTAEGAGPPTGAEVPAPEVESGSAPLDKRATDATKPSRRTRDGRRATRRGKEWWPDAP